MGFSLFGLKEGMASWSMLIIILSLVLLLLMYVWMRMCYFPGGLKRSQVVDIGQIHRYDLAGDVEFDLSEDKRVQQEEWERRGGVGPDPESGSAYDYEEAGHRVTIH